MAGTRYALRSDLRNRRMSYLALAVLVAVGGGVALAAVAGARRTVSAYPRYLQASNASDVSLDAPSLGSPTVRKRLARLPGVSRAASYQGFYAAPLDAKGKADPNTRPRPSGASTVATSSRTVWSSSTEARRSGSRFGVTRREVSVIVAWQATITIGLALLIGVPVGVAIGRVLWTRFANSVGVIPRPTVPVLTLSLVAVGVLVLANLIAALPGRAGSRTEAAVVLRSE